MSEKQCDHWNTKYAETGVKLRPLRCTLDLGHLGKHAGGGSSWTETLGERYDPSGVIHDCPREGESVTLCCGKSPFELPIGDRVTLDPSLVTCKRAVSA